MLTINLQDSLICVYLTPLIHEPAFVWKEIKYDALAKCRHDAFILTISTDYISQIDRIKVQNQHVRSIKEGITFEACESSK